MLEPGVQRLFARACRAPLLLAAERVRGPQLEAEAVESLLPHRGVFRLVDRITGVLQPPSSSAPGAAGTIVCRYDLARAAPIIAGHFPGRPLWPGVLHVEAIGQAGLCLYRLSQEKADTVDASACMLTDILAGRYLRPVVPEGEVEIVARILRDGLFVIVVGQCLKDDIVCSAAAIRGIEEEVVP
jgi:3-hydroxymyristoyl/3-hydroxydecanoyl-(acyl carrier protein) dehydratase